MTTSSLIARLQQGLTEHRDIKPEQLFKRVEAQCLDKIIQLSPKKGAGPSLQLSSRTLMTTFGNQFRIKGSAVSRFMTPMKQKVQLSLLNDIDIVIKVKNLQLKDIERKLAHVLRQAKAMGEDKKRTRAILSRLTDQDFFKTYVHSWLEGEGFIKVRLNVAANTIPLDLVLCQQLTADFDRLLGSKSLDVDVNTKTAQQHRVLNDKSYEWLEKQNLDWFHDEMSAGLPRLQKWATNVIKGQLLQPFGLIQQLYAKDSLVNQAKFAVWLVKHHAKNAVMMTPLHAISQAFRLEIEALSQDSATQPNTLMMNLTSTISPEDNTAFFSEELVQCVQFFHGCDEQLAQFLINNSTLLNNFTDQFDKIFTRVDLPRLAALWQSEDVQDDPQLQTLLFPLTQFYLETTTQPDTRAALEFFQSKAQGGQAELTACLKVLPFLTEKNTLTVTDAPKFDKCISMLERQSVMKRAVALTVQQFKQTKNDVELLILAAGLLEMCSNRDLKNVKPLGQFFAKSPLDYASASSPTLSNLKSFAFFNSVKHQVGQCVVPDTQSVSLSPDSHQDLIAVLSMLLKNKDTLTGCIGGFFIDQAGKFDLKSKGIWVHLVDQYCGFTAKGEAFIGAMGRCKNQQFLHGRVAMLDTQQRLTIADFKNNQIEDCKALIQTPGASFQLALRGTTVHGEGEVKIHQYLHEADSIAAAVFLFLADDTMSTPASFPRATSLQGQWYGPLNAILELPLTTSTRSILELKASNDSLERAKVMLRNGRPERLIVDCYRQQPEFSLEVKVRPNDLNTLFSSADVVLRKSNASGETMETAYGLYDPIVRKIISTDAVEREHDCYYGEFDGLHPHGIGHIIRHDEPYGRHVEMSQGREFDEDLVRFTQGKDPMLLIFGRAPKLRRLPIFMFTVPISAPAAYFSLRNKQKSKMYGEWSDKLFTGVLRQNSRPNQDIIGHMRLLLPETLAFVRQHMKAEICSTWRSTLSKLEQVAPREETFISTHGLPMVVVPHGFVNQKSQDDGISSGHLLAFGQILPEAALQWKNRTYQVFSQLAAPDRFFIFENDHVFYNVRVQDRVLDQVNHQAPWAQVFNLDVGFIGTMTSCHGHYHGEFKGLMPQGIGRHANVHGTVFQGHFHQEKFQSGQMRCANGVVIHGHWQHNILTGDVKVEIPLPDGSQLYCGTMSGSQCVVPLQPVDSQRSPASDLPTGQEKDFNLWLKQFNLSLLPSELRLLNDIH